MAELKYEKYIVKKPKPNEVAEFVENMPPEDVRKRVLYLDDEVVEGAFYMATTWFFKATPGQGVEPHTHEFDEVLGFFGSNPDDVYDLCGEVEFWIEDEKYLITNSFMAFVPAGVQHCPLKVHRADRPIFHYSVGPGKMYGGKQK